MTEIHSRQETDSPIASSVRGDRSVRTYTVYHFDYIRQVSEPVGKLVDRRNRDREENVGSLWKLAQKLYPPPMGSRLVITPD